MSHLVQKERKMWIDIFRTITICLVVMGHITGRFNGYIYQFHMAAFFWLSGFCTNWYRCPKKQLVWERFFSLVIPTIVVFLFGTLGMWILNTTNTYSFLWGEMAYIGVRNMLCQFFIYGRNYVWWMGATWFLISLFQIFILHAFLIHCFDIKQKKYRVLYGSAIILVYTFGFYYTHTAGEGIGISAAIGQLYFGIGVLCQNTEINKKINREINNFLLLGGILLTVVAMELFSHIKDIGVDYPSGKFEHILLNVFAALNGILLLIFISKLIEQLLKNIRIVKEIIAYISKNTIGVVFFHFLMFKICIGILILFRVVDYSYIQNFIPIEDDIGLRFFWIFLPISIAGSIGLWKVCNLTYVGRVLLGGERNTYRKWYSLLAKASFCIKIRTLYLSFIEKLMKSKKNCWRRWLCCPKYEKGIIVFLLSMYLADGIMIIQQGIILNDELVMHLKRLDGFGNLIGYTINNELRMKRPLRILAAINSSITFCFENIYLDRIIMVLLIGIALLVFAFLINELFEKRNIAYISICLFLVFVPLLYEHGAPNAFIGLVIIPFIELCIALIFWYRYLKTDKKSHMVLGTAFWVLALGGYEFVVTYTPLFVLLYFLGRDKRQKSFHDFVCKVFLPIICGVIYLALTFIFQRILGEGYEGTVMNLTSISDIWNVEKILFLSCLPGYFLFNRKYVYLVCAYSQHNGGSIADIVARESLSIENIWEIFWCVNRREGEILKEIFIIMIRSGMSLGIFLLVIGAGVLFYFIIGKTARNPLKKVQYKSKKTNFLIICGLVLYMFLPQLPNAVSDMYQKTVSENFFIWLPVSIFLFFTTCLCLGYILNLCIERWQKSTIIFFGIFLILFGIPTQYMNKIISSTNHKDFNRLLNIEALFQTECIGRLDKAAIYAPDLFETKNLLAVNDNYWNEYSFIKGKDIKIIKERQEDGDHVEVWLNMIEDSQFCIISEEEIAVLSKKKMPDYFMVKLDNDEYAVFSAAKYSLDNGFYCYAYEWKDGKAIPLEGKDIFENFKYSVGTTLADAEIRGRYEDGWCKREALLRIESGEDGKLVFEGYCPLDLTDTKERNIIVMHGEEKLVEYQVVNDCIYFEVIVEKDTEYDLKILSDFLINSTNGDNREMSYILTNVY